MLERVVGRCGEQVTGGEVSHPGKDVRTIGPGGPGRPRVWPSCSHWTAPGTERIECDELSAGPFQRLRGRRWRHLDQAEENWERFLSRESLH